MPRPTSSTLRRLFAASALATLVTALPLPAHADYVPARHARSAPAARRVSLMPLRAKIETLGHFFDEPQWLDRDTVLAHANIADGFLQTPYQINLRNGRNRLLNLQPEINDCKPAHWSLSPDKKWVLWRQGRLDPTSTIFAARLDGRGSRSWTMSTNDSADCVWLPRSHRWVSFRRREADSVHTYEAALIHDLDKPKVPPQIVPLPATVQPSEVVGVVSDSRILMVKRPDDAPHPAPAIAKLLLVDLHAPKRLHQIQIASPEGMKRVNEIRLSPNGRSLAWEFCVCDEKAERTTFYISDLSGRKMRRVKLPDTKPDEGLYLRGWYSDSRALLFEVRQGKEVPKSDYLYRVAVS